MVYRGLVQGLMKVYLRWFQVVFQNCWCFTKGQFIFLFQVGQGFSLELAQHLFMVDLK